MTLPVVSVCVTGAGGCGCNIRLQRRKDKDVFLVRTLYKGEGETPWLHPHLWDVGCHVSCGVCSRMLPVL